MNEIIKLWKEFIKIWNADKTNITIFDDKKRILKPSFYDFMSWLSENYKDEEEQDKWENFKKLYSELEYKDENGNIIPIPEGLIVDLEYLIFGIF